MSAITQVLARWGALPAADLYVRLSDEFGTERSIQRALKAEPDVLAMGKTTRRAYALRRPEIAPATIMLRHEDGSDSTVATITGLAAGQWWVDAEPAAPKWITLGQREETPGIFQGLPWYLEPFRPAGFLGRAWVREHAAAHGWTVDVNAWSEDQVIEAALQQPWDTRGNLGLARIAGAADAAVPAAQRQRLYAERAAKVLNGEMVGASADGEQPKFTAVVDDGQEQPLRPVLVKFSPYLTDDPAAQRWGDIMVTEAVAAQVMTLNGMSAASTMVWRYDDRIWLETTRFDRIGTSGRRGMASLRALAQTFGYTGPQNGWVTAVEHLQRRGAVDNEQVDHARYLAAIGHLLANTDMHMGNLSFLLSSDAEPLISVAPAYDMAPMRWVPGATSGRVPALEPEAIPHVGDREALIVARDIWEETARHELVTPAWANWANDRARQLKEHLERSQN
jgi:hypothetical protein